MFAKGKIRGSGGGLAQYLISGEKGERAELIDTRGLEAFGRDPVAAFEMLQDIADANTRSTKPFFHGHVRLPANERLTDAQWMETLEFMEKRLGFEGQPRIATFHINEATGEKHLHVGWCRVDLETMRTIDPGLYKNDLRQLSREQERAYSLRQLDNERQPHDRAPAASQKEMEESRRLGTDVRDIRNAILNCFERSDNGSSFKAALDERGLMLANGDRRDCFVVIDHEGGSHALNKKLTSQTLAQLRERFADLGRGQLPSVEQAQEMQRGRQVERAIQEARAAAKGRTDDIRPEGERRRYDALREAEQRAEAARAFDAAAGRTTEPAASVWDRDAASRAIDEKIIDASISAELEKAHQARGAEAEGERAARRAEREQVRPPNWVEQRLADCAYQTGINGAIVQIDAEGQRVGRIEALADQFRPERQTESVRIFGPDAFAARLDDADLAIVRVTEADTKALEVLRQEEQLARMAAAVNNEAYSGHHFADLVAGELAAVTRFGDVHRINLDKAGAARDYLPDALPSVTEARARFEIEHAQEGKLWTERRADIQASQQEYSALQEQRADDRVVSQQATALAATTEATVDRAAHAGAGLLRGLGKIFESVIGFLADSIAPPPPPTRDQAERMVRTAEEKQEQQAAAARQQAEHEFILREMERSRQSAEQRPTTAELYGTPKPGGPARDNERDRDRDYEREL